MSVVGLPPPFNRPRIKDPAVANAVPLCQTLAVQLVKIIQHLPDSISNLLPVDLPWLNIQIAMLGKPLQVTVANLDADNKKAAKPPFPHPPRA